MIRLHTMATVLQLLEFDNPRLSTLVEKKECPCPLLS
jgi:hypothetical protein